MNNILSYFKKFDLKKIDKKSAIVIIIGFIGIAVIFISEFDFKNNEKNVESDCETKDDYCEKLEDKLELFIESIDGAGETQVIITLEESTEYIYATDGKEITKKNENSSDQTVENNYVIIKNNNENTALLKKTIAPKVRGVAISCSGGDNIAVQEQIYSAVSALLNVSTSDISISKLEYSEEKYEE